MASDSALPPEGFNEILAWLNSDREVAARIYLQLRNDLERMFTMRHCADPQGLVDETFDRVAKRLREIRPTYKGDPRVYFYGVARNLIREDTKKVKTQVSVEDIEAPRAQTAEVEEETEDMREECLHDCLRQLSAEQRRLIINYYAKEKQAKIDYRAQLAQQLGTTVETLRVKVFRIRNTLMKCIEQCLDRKAQRK